MAEIHEVMFTRAQNHAGLSALISYGSGLYSFYPLVYPRDGNLPAVVYQRIDTPRVHTHDTGPTSLARPRFQLSSWATTYAGAEALGRQVRLAFDGWRDTSASLRVDCAQQDNQSADFEEVTGLWRVISDFIVFHEEETS